MAGKKRDAGNALFVEKIENLSRRLDDLEGRGRVNFAAIVDKVLKGWSGHGFVRVEGDALVLAAFVYRRDERVCDACLGTGVVPELGGFVWISHCL